MKNRLGGSSVHLRRVNVKHPLSDLGGLAVQDASISLNVPGLGRVTWRFKGIFEILIDLLQALGPVLGLGLVYTGLRSKRK